MHDAYGVHSAGALSVQSSQTHALYIVQYAHNHTDADDHQLNLPIYWKTATELNIIDDALSERSP